MAHKAQFAHEGVTAALENTFGASLAYGAFLSVFGMTPAVKTNKQGESVETSLQIWTRYFCLIAAYSNDVTGLDWQPPSLYADANTIRASSERFLKVAAQSLIVAWVTVAINVMNGDAVIVPEAERGTGDPEQDFLAKTGSELPASSSTAPLES